MTDTEFRNVLLFVLQERSFPDSVCHGLKHWNNVYLNARFLAEKEGVNPLIPSLFAICHDFQRLSDGADLQHGPRAATRIKAEGGGIFSFLSEEELGDLVYACQTHTGGRKAPKQRIALCWDADRLDIGRVGIVPQTRFFHSQTARQMVERQDYSELDAYKKTQKTLGQWLYG